MAEKTARHDPFEDKIPNEVREHLRAARDEFRESIIAMMPPEFVQHRRKARKEMLLAWRSMIDSALQRIEEKENKAG